ncbi:MAG: hypothetical protein H7Y38_13690, partial [Armatimonadetes bacterium]|nr:hypothetical protein [Armatimonadota bacterium]
MSVPVTAAPSVEPELFCAAPRRVVPVATVYQWRIFLANAIVGLSLLAYYLAVAPATLYWRDLVWACVFAIVGIGIGWLAWEARVRRDAALLREGYATRATVTAFNHKNLDYDGYAELKYQYRTDKMDTMITSFSVTGDDAAKYDFSAGATFTVLIAPGEAY